MSKSWFVTLWIDIDPEADKFAAPVYTGVVKAGRPSLAIHRAYRDFQSCHPGRRIGTFKAKATDVSRSNKRRVEAFKKGRDGVQDLSDILNAPFRAHRS